MKITMLPGMDEITRGRPVKEPSTAERMVSNAHDAKVHATDRWVRRGERADIEGTRREAA